VAGEDAEKAAGRLGRVVEAHPGYVQARTALAEAQLAAGQYATALDTASAALARDPFDRVALMAGAHARIELGRAKGALRDLERAHELAVDGRVLALLGRTHNEMRAPERALGYLTKSVEMGGGLPALVEMGRVHEGSGARDDAREAYAKALKIDPTAVEPRLRLGALAAAEGDHDKAIELLEPLVALAPDDEDAHLALARAYMEAGQSDRARVFLNDVLAVNAKSSRAHYRLGQILASEGKLPEATSRLELAVQLDPALLGAREELVSALASQGRYDDALEHLEVALRQAKGNTPRGVRLLLQMGDLHGKRRDQPDVEEARKAYGRILTVSHDNARALHRLGMLDLETAPAAAVRRFHAAQHAEPLFPDPYRDAGYAYLVLGQCEAALGNFRAYLEMAPRVSDRVEIQEEISSLELSCR
jgi:tetratricopeptide (TPR) repeat protein